MTKKKVRIKNDSRLAAKDILKQLLLFCVLFVMVISLYLIERLNLLFYARYEQLVLETFTDRVVPSSAVSIATDGIDYATIKEIVILGATMDIQEKDVMQLIIGQ